MLLILHFSALHCHFQSEIVACDLSLSHKASRVSPKSSVNASISTKIYFLTTRFVLNIPCTYQMVIEKALKKSFRLTNLSRKNERKILASHGISIILAPWENGKRKVSLLHNFSWRRHRNLTRLSQAGKEFVSWDWWV